MLEPYVSALEAFKESTTLNRAVLSNAGSRAFRFRFEVPDHRLIERSVILTTGRTLNVSLPARITGAIDAVEVVGNFEEQARIVSVLRETKGRISGPGGAALRLGVKRSTLLDRMKKLGIDAREVRNSGAYVAA
jgi:transcriptional regulator with GAF, ATPase, and Fis domain